MLVALLQVDDKYQYSCDNKDLKVHGWISMDPPVGFWQITPSDEFRSGGPVKQNLTSHVGPTALSVGCYSLTETEIYVGAFKLHLIGVYLFHVFPGIP